LEGHEIIIGQWIMEWTKASCATVIRKKAGGESGDSACGVQHRELERQNSMRWNLSSVEGTMTMSNE
jgi:hypothetical protein